MPHYLIQLTFPLVQQDNRDDIDHFVFVHNEEPLAIVLLLMNILVNRVLSDKLMNQDFDMLLLKKERDQDLLQIAGLMLNIGGLY